MASIPTPPPQAAVHPAVQPLSFLIGMWKGQGDGNYPTISPFKYSEELQFSHSPNKPVLAYSSKTWKLSSGEPMHSESGYWRPKPDGTIEVVIAQSTGLVEVQKGTYDAEQKTVKLKSALVGNASKVKKIKDRFRTISNKTFPFLQDFLADATLKRITPSDEPKQCRKYLVQTLVSLCSQVKDVHRVYEMVNGDLAYLVEMATHITSLQIHLKAILRKIS